MASIFCSFVIADASIPSAPEDVFALVKQSLTAMAQVPSLAGLFYLFSCLLEVLSNYNEQKSIAYSLATSLTHSLSHLPSKPSSHVESSTDNPASNPTSTGNTSNDNTSTITLSTSSSSSSSCVFSCAFSRVFQTLRLRVGRAVVMFGHYWYGLISIASFRGLTFPVPQVQALEDLLARHVRYFARFTGPDVNFYDLVENDQTNRAIHLHENLPRRMSELIEAMAVESSDFFTFPDDISDSQLRLPCDSLKYYRLHNDDSRDARRKLAEIMKQIPGVESSNFDSEQYSIARREFLASLDQRKSAIEDVTRLTESAIYSNPIRMILHPAIASFWIHSIGANRPVVLRNVLVKRIEDLLRRDASLDAEVRAGIIKVLGQQLSSNSQNESDLVDFYSFAKLFRSVPRDETDFSHVLTTMSANLDGRLLCCIPAVSRRREVFYDPWQLENLVELLASEGWCGITGPQWSGKSTRLLFALHSMLPQYADRDYLWIDFDRVHSAPDACARLATQMYWRRCNQQEDLFSSWESTVTAMRPNSIIVFDNIRPGSESWETFFSRLCEICTKNQHLRCVVVSNQFHQVLSYLDTTLITFATVVRIDMLHPETAFRMASTFHPITRCGSNFSAVDPAALVIASCGMSGYIAQYSSSLSLGALRMLSDSVYESDGDAEKIAAAQTEALKSVFCDLSRDEQVLVCCLLPHAAFFDEGMVWAMSSHLLGEDIIRWKLAWCTLVDVGWVMHNPELGYCVTPFASLLQFRVEILTSQQLFDKYMIHWARELRNLNILAADNPTYLEWFSRHLAHYSAFLQAMFYQSTSRPAAHKKKVKHAETVEALKPTFRRLAPALSTSSTHIEPVYEKFTSDYVLEDFYTHRITVEGRQECLVNLIGNIGRVLSYHMSAGAGMTFTKAVVDDSPAAWAVLQMSVANRMMSEATTGKRIANGAVTLEVTSGIQHVPSTESQTNSPGKKVAAVDSFGNEVDYEEYAEQAKTEGEIFLAAGRIDYAEQCLRYGHIELGLNECADVLKDSPSIDESLEPIPPQKTKQLLRLLQDQQKLELKLSARAQLVYGRLLLADGRPIEALQAFSEANRVYTHFRMSSDDNWEAGLLARLLAEAKMLNALNNAGSSTGKQKRGLTLGFRK